ncbi:hypothetical protein QJS10_CPA01g01455 [Acorus calamus]|uniref:Fiber protein Fb34 n=1 Tax=Acorus calamus TaxID=4465 RepID=A0AAV9FPI2_ACOCL|nr:hypothetical protein QJS10_CPA01g01455 [Acorus calamus]
MMGEGKASTLVLLLVVALSLVSFGFSIAAERRRSTGTIVTDVKNMTYCVYDSDVATGLSFLIAEACIIGGAAKNAYHTKYRGALYAQNWSCESLRKGVFIAGAVFVVFTMVLNVYYYMYFNKASSQASRKNNRANSTVGMAGYP